MEHEHKIKEICNTIKVNNKGMCKKIDTTNAKMCNEI